MPHGNVMTVQTLPDFGGHEVEAEAVRRAAGLISQARLRGTTLKALPDDVCPADEHEAYAVQDEVHRLLSGNQRGRTVGHKIGCTTPVMQEFLGIPNPCAGAVFQPTVHFQEGMLKHAEYLHPGVECELAVSIGSDLPPGKTPHTRESVAHAVSAVFAGIEIVDDRWEDYTQVSTPELIADDFFGAGCVLSGPNAGWKELDMENVRGQMRINGRTVGEGRGADILGHPFEALSWLANSLNERGAMVRRGEIVMLGSLVQTNWVNHMDQVEVEIEGIGSTMAWFG